MPGDPTSQVAGFADKEQAVLCQEVVARFRVQRVLVPPTDSYNIAPAQPIPVIVQDEPSGERLLLAYQWGLVPSWAKHPGIGKRLINARAETLADKPSFKDAFMHRRCLIPASGFLVWKQEGEARLPLYVRPQEGDFFGFAGLWEEWLPPGQQSDVKDEALRTCAIVTVRANRLIAPFQARMPAILQPTDEAAWLDPANQDVEQLRSLLKVYPADQMVLDPVAPGVNPPATDDPRSVQPTEDRQETLPLE